MTTTWSWVDGTSAIYDNWALGEPNNMDDAEDCAEVSMEPLDKGKWNDISCGYGFGFVCKYAKGWCSVRRARDC